MGEAQGEIAVVGEKQKSGRVVVEAPHRKKPPSFAQPLQIGREVRPVLGIIERGNDAGRFVKRIIKRRGRRLNPLAIDFDAVFARVGLGAELSDNCAIDRNSALGDPALRFAS